MKRYRIREGSVIDYMRYGMTGLVLFVGLAVMYGLSI